VLSVVNGLRCTPRAFPLQCPVSEVLMTSRRSFLSCAAALMAAPLVAADEPAAPQSFAKTFNQLEAKKTKVGVSHPIFNGKSGTTGSYFETHATSLDPGQSPHPPHQHKHDELFLVRSGSLDFTVNGQTTRLGPGSVALAANNDLHGVKNVGNETAEYFVVAIGRDNA
jgi:quercetin dioxygenase-like cupin family protein